jgi:arsenite methyltransferase
MSVPALPSLLDGDGDLKACCAELYASEAAHWLLGDELHPGGERITLRLAEMAGVRRGDRVMDVAAGPGTTARLLARTLGAEVVGIELSGVTVERARRATDDARVQFLQGDAEALPLPDSSFDVVLCECSLCTFPDKPRAVAEMVRVLRPGGRIAIADVAADAQTLPEELRTAAARVACVADARTEDEYIALLEATGSEVLARERRDADLVAMIDRIEARLRVARMLVAPGEQRGRVREAIELARLARAAAERSTLGYALLVARPARRATRKPMLRAGS